MSDFVFNGSLFSGDFLTQSIAELSDWASISDADVDALEADLRNVLNTFPTSGSPNEAQTEEDLIWPVLQRLGWTQYLRQQNLSPRGREDVPDGLLFADADEKARANAFPEEWRRYQFGLATVESKRWNRPLDRRSGRRGEETAPSTQMLRYLRRIEDLTTGNLRWGILTNGTRWRLYYQGARSVSEQFFEIDLAAVLGLPGHGDGLFALSDDQRRHWLRVFMLVFRREAFLPSPTDERTFHQRALAEARYYEERVAGNLANVVFRDVFPALVRTITASAPSAELEDVREAALILLYRLLFIFYAEDRDLLPVNDHRYDDYALRQHVRLDVGRRKDNRDTFSTRATRYWSTIQDLCRAINAGDPSIGLPPYNGGLFDPERTPLLEDVRLDDQTLADVIDALSFEATPDGRKYINYRDLSVQQLGSIYERLLEQEVVREDGDIAVRPNPFARRGSGSYYTPDDLVKVIIDETVSPLVEERREAFRQRADELAGQNISEDRRLGRLKAIDPAEKILELKVCDPAMGSGHFLVSLVDYLADQLINAVAEAEATVENYVSPLGDRIERIRNTILDHAEDAGWTIDPAQLDDRHVIRRMILKRCVYGVDKNPMAVELAKVSLWLHTFTVGAPLSFLDHHLRCGNSLFGCWVREALDKAERYGTPLHLHDPIDRALRAASKMQIIEGLTDAEIAEAHRSADVFAEVQEMTAPLDGFLSLIHALDWLDPRERSERTALRAFFDGEFGDPVAIAAGRQAPNQPAEKRDDEVMRGQMPAREKYRVFKDLLDRCFALIREERFLNWQVAFPGIWRDWRQEGLHGGFDAVIGNPPWDRLDFEETEWFATRSQYIAKATGSTRKHLIDDLKKENATLWREYQHAFSRTQQAARLIKNGDKYHFLNKGKLNIYKLFVERSHEIINMYGLVGLLTPSGIASDRTSANFFKRVAAGGRLKALYDFENRRTRYAGKPFFPDIDTRFKFCVFVAGYQETRDPARCAFFLQDISEISNPDTSFALNAQDFARVNPNTGTAPIFRSKRDADLTTSIYARLPILVDRSASDDTRTWPVKYMQGMFNMTSDSSLFRTRQQLEEQEGAWPIEGNRFRGPNGDWIPLYEGKMVQAFDHRAASIVVNPDNQHRPAQPKPTTYKQYSDPNWVPNPQFWVPAGQTTPRTVEWLLCFKDVTSPTNVRSMISAVIPAAATGNTLPALIDENGHDNISITSAFLLLANLNSTIFDYVARQKIQGQHLNWYIVEQLPVVPPGMYEDVTFGSRTAADIVRAAVLELTYTAHDMAPFARDLGYVDENGEVRPPFTWDPDRRLRLRAKLDAVFFHLYGITDRDDVRYVYSTFPIVEREETTTYGHYRSRDLCLAYMNALAAGEPDAEPAVAAE
jgi:hypothetical protein